MKAICPQGQVIALIHDEEDRGPVEAAGADTVLSLGISAAKLREAITEVVYSDMGE
jgi:hypothetical protein